MSSPAPSPIGKIVALDANGATVEVERSAACARCAAGRGCGAGLSSGVTRFALLNVPLPAAGAYRVGDNVVLTLASVRLLRATALVYGLPLAGMLLALAAATMIGGAATDTAAMIIATGGLGAGVIAARWRLGRRSCLETLIPQIGGRVPARPHGR